MAENEKDPAEKKTLSLSKNLEVKRRIDAGQIRQSFAHGRSKSVAVEVKKKRSLDQATLATEQQEKALSTIAKESGLSDRELETRMRILRDAQQAEELDQKKRQEEQARIAQNDAQRQEEMLRKKQQEEERRKQEEEAEAERLKAEAFAKETATTQAPQDVPSEKAERKPTHGHGAVPVKAQVKEREGEAEADKRGVERKAELRKTLSLGKREVKQKIQRLDIGDIISGEPLENERQVSMAALRRMRDKKRGHSKDNFDSAPAIREVVVPEAITVQELANRMAVRAGEVIKKLMGMGVMATLNQIIDADTAELVISEFGHTIKRVSDADVEEGLGGGEDHPEDMVTRAPVVTVMGHVDHGKTSLLDAIRRTDVVSSESGGITQHIGAYQVTMPSGKKISFIDTPGHAAFSEMRARGANVTDIVVLVVAADDGIKEQTVEAINHAKAAGVPIIVAINKIDKPAANPDRVLNELLSHELVPESLGGDIPCVPVSAKQNMNLDKLEETILLVAEMQDLKANPRRDAAGVVVESKVDKGRGPVATVLIQKGTLRIGDIFVAGNQSGRVRVLVNDKGQKIEEAGPSLPVEVLGFSGAPNPGDTFFVLDDESKAKEIAAYRLRREKTKQAAALKKTTLEELFSPGSLGKLKELPVIIKSDVQGSVEAIVGSLMKIESEEVSVKILHSGVGGINEGDITLAEASKALVVGFNVRANPQARDLASKSGVEIRYYSIIYNVIDDVKAILSGLLTPTYKENFLGYAEIRDVFNITKVGKVAGCYVTSGTVKRGAKVRLLRDDVVIHEGSLKTLKRFKDEVKEVKESYECGMAFENYNDIRPGDVIECFEVEAIARQI